MENLISVVLLSEDNNFKEELVDKISQCKNYYIGGVFNHYDDCIDHLHNYKCHVLIVDLILSNFDGITVIEKIKADNQIKLAHIFCCSNYFSKEICREIERLKIAHIFKKPIACSCIIERINQLYRYDNVAYNNKKRNYLVYDKLVEIGVPPHLNGFDYLEAAITIVIENDGAMLKLYEQTALYLGGTTKLRVEQCIRNAVHVTCNHYAKEEIIKQFGRFKNDYPPNYQFISAIANLLIRRF